MSFRAKQLLGFVSLLFLLLFFAGIQKTFWVRTLVADLFCVGISSAFQRSVKSLSLHKLKYFGIYLLVLLTSLNSVTCRYTHCTERFSIKAVPLNEKIPEKFRVIFV